MPAFCTDKEINKHYSIEYTGMKNSAYDFTFEVGNALFEAYESREIRGGKCLVKATMIKSERQLDFDFSIEGYVICECDRCLDDCNIDIDYEGHLVVRISDEEGEYDGEIMWLNPAEDAVDLTQYIYESIVLSLPYQRVHPEGECNPDMMARFAQISGSEFEAMVAQAEQNDKHGIGEGDFNKLAALKAQMEKAND